MTPGERRLAQRLRKKLDDDYVLWYDVPVGKKQLRPDFMVLHPDRGLLILEVKDWKIDTIRSVNRQTATIITPDGEKNVKNPCEQARDYMLEVQSSLAKDSMLINPEGRYKGKLAFPTGYGAVFTNITRKQFETQEGFREVFEPNLVLCQDEMYENVDPYECQKRLWGMFNYNFGEPLTATQIDRVRWIIFPEMRIGDSLVAIPVEEEPVEIPDIMRVLDLKQEELARSIGDGHRVIHGVAGSGKTLILVYQCLHLLEKVTKPILVLVFNVSLAAKIRSALHEKGVGPDRVHVRHFHGWCNEQLRNYRIEKPSFNQFRDEAYIEELVQRVIDGVARGAIPTGRYGGVLIDEGHDFEPKWLKLAAQMVAPETNSLLVMYDDAQNIYGTHRKSKFNFKQLGIQAQGRTTVLKIRLVG
jgi:hypothetical protein